MTGSPPPRIAFLSFSFPPAYLRGGPSRTLGALTSLLSDRFDVFVLTSSRDDLRAGPMEGTVVNQWTDQGGVKVLRSLKRSFTPSQLVRHLREVDPQVLHLNSLFDWRFSTVPLVVARIWFRDRPVILAPRGELAPGALTISSTRKRLFLSAFRLLGLDKAVVWHASTEHERRDIEQAMRGSRRRRADPPVVRVAVDPTPTELVPDERTDWTSAPCRVVFYSRIVPKKNLHTLLGALRASTEAVELTIAGPKEDPTYWRRCWDIVGRLPAAVSVVDAGVIQGRDAVQFLSEFDLFVLPTLGENYGHVVVEALAAGLPVIVGRDTPWHVAQEHGAGWVCDPLDEHQIRSLIHRFVALSPEEKMKMSRAARSLAQSVIDDPSTVDENYRLFEEVLVEAAGRRQ